MTALGNAMFSLNDAEVFARKYVYLSLDVILDVICSSKLTASASWDRKFEKMTADKYPHLF